MNLLISLVLLSLLLSSVYIYFVHDTVLTVILRISPMFIYVYICLFIFVCCGGVGLAVIKTMVYLLSCARRSSLEPVCDSTSAVRGGG